MKPVVVIPARGGSKGLAGKNLRTMGGISLVGRAIRVGRAFLRTAGLDGVVLVDTDDEAIAAEGRRFGAAVPWLRPAELATDTAPMVDNVMHAVERARREIMPVDAIVLLQPTSPLRDVEDVLACWRAFDPRVPGVVAVVEQEHPAEQTLRLAQDGTLTWAWPNNNPTAQRQGFAPGFRLSGSVYVTSASALSEHRAFLVPGRTRGVMVPRQRAVDVDTAADLAEAEAWLSAQPLVSFSLAGRSIGPGSPCFVIAEAGVNHNGDVALALRLVDAAADAGADAVKFQTFNPDRLAAPDAPMAAYQVANTRTKRTQAEMLRALALPRSAYADLKARATKRGILFLSSPFDEESADFLDALGVPAFKLGSGELTNHPLLAHIAAKGKPMLVSTGMADLAEVVAAVDLIAAAGPVPVAALHCVTSYPAAPADANLRAMATMRAALGLPIGWSDHSEGIEVALAATALGAAVLEKHITLDRSMPGPDHKASLEPKEFAQLVRAVRAVESSLGSGDKRPQAAELALVASARKSLHATRQLSAGHVLAPGDLVALRPGTGISPARLESVLGRPLKVALAQGQRLLEKHLG